jgi:hypothetical protein
MKSLKLTMDCFKFKGRASLLYKSKGEEVKIQLTHGNSNETDPSGSLAPNPNTGNSLSLKIIGKLLTLVYFYWSMYICNVYFH